MDGFFPTYPLADRTIPHFIFASVSLMSTVLFCTKKIGSFCPPSRKEKGCPFWGSRGQRSPPLLHGSYLHPQCLYLCNKYRHCGCSLVFHGMVFGKCVEARIQGCVPRSLFLTGICCHFLASLHKEEFQMLYQAVVYSFCSVQPMSSAVIFFYFMIGISCRNGKEDTGSVFLSGVLRTLPVPSGIYL